MAYQITKWVHILAAITALGANITYGVWIRRASKKPEVLPFTLRTVKLIDDWIANPAYILLLLTGFTMVWLTSILLTTPWLLTSLVLYAGLAMTGLLAYTPTLKRQIEIVEELGPAAEAYKQISRRSTRLGIVLAVLAVAIVFLMVIKPPLWG